MILTKNSPWLRWMLLGGIVLTIAPAGAARRKPHNPPPAGDPGIPHAAADRVGFVQTLEGQTLHLSADLGTVHIFTLEPGAAPMVRYNVHIETDVRAPLADHLLSQYSLAAKSSPSGVQIIGALPPQSAHGRASEAQFWVRFDVTIPHNYSVEVSTGAGDIETVDIGGTASLITQGGNIRAGRIGATGLPARTMGRPVARLETEGGHITVQDVAGDLIANTGGGHINAGNISGDATLHSGGGHIHAESIAGRADLDTKGGNITVRQAGSTVSVHTGGGQIDFGEVRGAVRAQTGGGGIRVMYVAGPLEVETSAGSICLTRVGGSVRAQTAGGTITAWISPDSPSQSAPVRLAGASQLSSGAGDIVVFLPRNLAATIDATVEHGGENYILVDPSLLLNIQSAGIPGGPVRATGVLNGGGALLRLRTVVGKIHLQYVDSDVALRQSLMREQTERINRYLREMQMSVNEQIEAARKLALAAEGAPQEKSGWFGFWWDGIEEKVRGGISEDPRELKKYLIHSTQPAYPEIAKKAGIEGRVRLQVRVGRDGRVEVLKVLEGEPVLADAAIAAVKQWQYRPKQLNGKRVNVISEVSVGFQLH